MDTPPYTDPLLCLLAGYAVIPVLSAAWELDLPQILADAGPAGLRAAQVARRLSKKAANSKQEEHKHVDDDDSKQQEARLHRLLRFLAAHDLVQETVNGEDVIYSLAPGRLLDSEEEETAMSPFCLASAMGGMLFHPAFHKAWTKLPDLLLHGPSSGGQEEEDESLFSIFNSNPAFRRTFNTAMLYLSTRNSRYFCGSTMNTSYDFDPLREARSLVDVGGGDGKVAARLARRYPHLTRVLNLDLPPVIALAPPRPGVEHIKGDMFLSIPSADIILLNNVLHNWSDEDCIKVLRKAHDSLTGCKKLVIVDLVIGNTISEESNISIAREKLAADIQMMVSFNNGGKERTKNNWDMILKVAKFENYKIVTLEGSISSVIEACIY